MGKGKDRISLPVNPTNLGSCSGTTGKFDQGGNRLVTPFRWSHLLGGAVYGAWCTTHHQIWVAVWLDRGAQAAPPKNALPGYHKRPASPWVPHAVTR